MGSFRTAICDEVCWTPKRCPTCDSPLGPRGRSVPLECHESECCAEARQASANKRHLWDEHDSTRHYSDPYGWAKHVESCSRCSEAA